MDGEAYSVITEISKRLALFLMTSFSVGIFLVLFLVSPNSLKESSDYHLCRCLDFLFSSSLGYTTLIIVDVMEIFCPPKSFFFFFTFRESETVDSQPALRGWKTIRGAKWLFIRTYITFPLYLALSLTHSTGSSFVQV
jgi:hypothetical protein